MNNLEAIELRHSRRSYLNTSIVPDHISKLENCIRNYNKQSGLSIQLILDGCAAFQGLNISYGMFSGVRSYFAIVGNSNDPHLKEKAGYYGELLVLEAVKLGLGTCFVGATYNRKNCPCMIKNDEKLVIIITVGNVPEKANFKENTIYKLIHRQTKSISDLYSCDEQVPDWFIKGIKAVQKAPSAANRQPVHFNYQQGTVTAKVTNPDNFQLIDLGIAKAHFEIGAGGKFELGNGTKFIKSSD